jgi:hypothetical protein
MMKNNCRLTVPKVRTEKEQRKCEIDSEEVKISAAKQDENLLRLLSKNAE